MGLWWIPDYRQGTGYRTGHQLRLAVGGLEMKAQIDKETAGAGLLKKGP